MTERSMLDIARERYTTKHYSGEKIPREDLEAILEVLRLSPSSVNSQPWHFFVASSDEARAKITPAFADFNRERVTLASDVIVLREAGSTKRISSAFTKRSSRRALQGNRESAGARRRAPPLRGASCQDA